MTRLPSSSLPWTGPVYDAVKRRLPACVACGALRGDPCRTPTGRTRPPHVTREHDYRRLAATWGAMGSATGSGESP